MEYKIFLLPIRIIQAIFALIVLGVMAYSISGAYVYSPSQINYSIFCAVWTLLIVAYLVFAPRNSSTVIAHKYAILAADAVTCLFWFAAFIAVAVFLNEGYGCSQSYGPCRAATAGVVFAAFLWLLFTLTTVLSALHCWETKNTTNNGPPPAALEIPLSNQHQASGGNFL